MKLYFAYKESGEFDGFYDDEIHSKIPVNSVEITQELQNELLIGLWFINIEKIRKIDKILDAKDKDRFFVEHEPDIPEYVDPQKVLLKQIMSNKLELMKKDLIINNLTKQLAQDKIYSMKKDTTITMLLKQQAQNKIEIMKMKEGSKSE